MAEYSANIYLGEKSAHITERSIRIVGEVTPDELCLIATTAELLRAVRANNPIAYSVNLDNIRDKQSICKCEWVDMDDKFQKFKIINYDNDKKYRHADTIKEAQIRYRIFTCPVGVALCLKNKKRPIVKEISSE